MTGDADLSMFYRLRALIRSESPDLVHVHSRRGADLWGGLAAQSLGVPAILSRRVDNPESRLQVRLKYGLYRRIIAISQGIRAVLRAEGVPEEKLRYVPSAVDTDSYRPRDDRIAVRRELGLEPDDVAIGVIAQLIPRKGHETLIAAAPRILERHPSARFLLFGRGPGEHALKRRVKDAGLDLQVLFMGFRQDLERVIPSLDLVVHPALMEGLGISLLQAAACEVPIVACQVGGVPEIVRDGENGLLVLPGDEKALAAAVERILGDRSAARRMGRRGREIAEQTFSIDTMVEGNHRIYQELTLPSADAARRG